MPANAPAPGLAVGGACVLTKESCVGAFLTLQLVEQLSQGFAPKCRWWLPFGVTFFFFFLIFLKDSEFCVPAVCTELGQAKHF